MKELFFFGIYSFYSFSNKQEKKVRETRRNLYMLMDVLENMEKISIKLPSCGFSFEV